MDLKSKREIDLAKFLFNFTEFKVFEKFPHTCPYTTAKKFINDLGR